MISTNDQMLSKILYFSNVLGDIILNPIKDGGNGYAESDGPCWTEYYIRGFILLNCSALKFCMRNCRAVLLQNLSWIHNFFRVLHTTICGQNMHNGICYALHHSQYSRAKENLLSTYLCPVYLLLAGIHLYVRMYKSIAMVSLAIVSWTGVWGR